MGRQWNIGKVIGPTIRLSDHFACVFGGVYDTLVFFCFTGCYWFMCWKVKVHTFSLYHWMFSLEVHVMEPSDLERVHLVHALNKVFLLINYFLQVFQMVMGNLQIQRAKCSQCTIFCQWFITLGELWMSMKQHAK